MSDRRKAVFFIVWPPPHPGVLILGRDRANLYWSRDEKNWKRYYQEGTYYETREAALEEAPMVAMLKCENAPNLEHLGKVKVIRMVVFPKDRGIPRVPRP